MTVAESGPIPIGELGDLLRYWRSVRGVSQLDLSLEAGVSQRQISFIESGRSVPGRQTLLTIAQALDVPLRERNTLLLSAGYAPIYSAAAWSAPEMQIVLRALERVVRHHDPFPAIVIDRHWNVLMANDAAPQFFGQFVDLASRKQPRNLMHLIFDPQGMRPYIANWDGVSRSLLQRVQRESLGGVVDTATRILLDELLNYPDVPKDWATYQDAASKSTVPVIPLTFMYDGIELSYFSMVTNVGAPRAIAAQELRLECLFPADDITEERHRKMLRSVQDAHRQIQAQTRQGNV